MNREETKAAIAVMQAYVDGEEIEFHKRSDSDSTWRGEYMNAGFVWDWEKFKYRIKPKPREFWLLIRSNETVGPLILLTKDEAKQLPPHNYIHVREVIEEGEKK